MNPFSLPLPRYFVPLTTRNLDEHQSVVPASHRSVVATVDVTNSFTESDVIAAVGSVNDKDVSSLATVDLIYVLRAATVVPYSNKGTRDIDGRRVHYDDLTGFEIQLPNVSKVSSRKLLDLPVVLYERKSSHYSRIVWSTSTSNSVVLSAFPTGAT